MMPRRIAALICLTMFDCGGTPLLDREVNKDAGSNDAALEWDMQPLIPIKVAETYVNCDGYCQSVGKTCRDNLCEENGVQTSALIWDCRAPGDAYPGHLIGDPWATCKSNIATNSAIMFDPGNIVEEFAPLPNDPNYESFLESYYLCSIEFDDAGAVAGLVYPALVQCCCD